MASNISSLLSSSPSAESQTPGVNPFGSLDSGAFIKVMLEEMSNQDPFKPNDTSQILEQLSSLRNIESQTSLQKALQTLVLQNGVAQAGGMIGKEVQGLLEDGRRVSGLVTSVRVMDGKAYLELDTGASLPLDRVEKIAQPAEQSASALDLSGFEV